MNDEQKRVLFDLNEYGIAKTSVSDFLSDSGKKYFENTLSFFQKHLNSKKIKDQINSFKTEKPIKGKNKWFELGSHDIIGRGCALEDDTAIPLYLRDEFFNVAEEYHQTSNCRLRNVLTWIHPSAKISEKVGSMNWHRDTENRKICKVFIYFNDVTSENGALNYTKYSRPGEKNHNIHPLSNIRGNGYLKENENLIPKEDIVTAEGKLGDIYFVDTYGYHRGGHVKKGIRLLTQGNFLPHDAEQIKNGPLNIFEWGVNSKRKLVYNLVDRLGEKYKNLSDRQKMYLS